MMDQRGYPSDKYSHLRDRAEDRLRQSSIKMPDIRDLSVEETENVLNDLLVHIHEQEIHIEDLHDARQAVEIARHEYSGLYDFAPVAYFTLSDKGLIQDVNFEGAKLIQSEKTQLVNMPFSHFVHHDDKDVYHGHNERVFERRSKQTCEVRLVKSGGAVFHAQLRTIAVTDGKNRPTLARIVVTDITDHKKSEQALRESEQRYRELINMSPDGIGVYDSRGDIVFVNDTLARVLEYAPSDLIGKSIIDIVYQDSREFETRRIREIVEKKIVQPFIETLWVRSDGTPVDVEVASASVSYRGAPAVQMVVRDITERRKAEEQLRKSELRFRHVYENVPMMMHSIDRDGRIVTVNRKWLEVMGYHQEEVVGRKVESVMTPESRATLRSVLPGFWSQGRISNLPYQYVKKDGSVIDVLLDSVAMDDPEWGKVSLSVIRDVTETKHAEQALRESEARYRALFENMREGVSIFKAEGEAEDFVFLDYNRSAERIDGAHREDVIGKSVVSVFPGLKDFGLFDVFQRVWRTGQPESHGVKKYVDKQLERWRDNFVYKLPSGEIVAVFSDETERKKADEELRKRTLDLSERIKELNCLYGISKLIENKDATLEQVLQGIVNLVSSAWQYRDVACARIVLDDQEYKTDDFRETPWKQTSLITAHGKQIGTLDVCYLEERPEEHEGPFMSEERRLLDAVAERLGRIVERNQAEVALRLSEERFRAIFESAEEYISIKDRDLRFVLVNPAIERLVNREAGDMVGLRSRELFGNAAGAHLEDVDLRVLDGESVDEERTIPVQEIPRTLHFTKVPLRDAEGVVIGICTIARDITERKRIAPKVPIRAESYPSPSMQATLGKARVAADTDSIVLLLGESGSGKDYLARWIHDHSHRAGGPFFAVNCAAVARDLAESELFGHERGAFTGAAARKKGILELAEGGTLLLNEIGELDVTLQAKLLAFLDTRSFLRVGGQTHIHVNARLIAATHRDLDMESAEGRFLRPLLYRLSVFPIAVPSLRDRPEDIPLLVDELILETANEMQLTEVPVIDPEHIRTLRQYHWPGNVRELKNVLERSLMLWAGERFDLTLPVEHSHDRGWSYTVRYLSGQTLREITDDVIRSLCSEVLHRCRGNKKETARLLGISRDALYRYIRRMDISSD
jgi:PAS domain S-box-containing protein